MAGPKLTANREDEEPHRITRLGRVAKHCPTNVIALHDHKGLLSVNWSSRPTTQELAEVAKAWEDENEYEIDHYLFGVLISEEFRGSNPFEVAEDATP